AAGHVLNQLVATFSSLPRRIRQRHDADVETLQLRHFSPFLPLASDEGRPTDLLRTRADGNATHASRRLQGCERIAHRAQVYGRGRRTDPTYHHRSVMLAAPRIRVALQIDDGGQPLHVAAAGASRTPSQILVTRGN